MAGGTGNAVASEPAVARLGLRRRIRGLIRHVVEGRAGKLAACAALRLGVDGALPLAENAMAAEAGILHERRNLLMEAFLARDLGKEDRGAAGEPHGRAAPGSVGRDVEELGVGGGLRHVELKPGAA